MRKNVEFIIFLLVLFMLTVASLAGGGSSWGHIHSISGTIFVIASTTHLAARWKWVKMNVFTFSKATNIHTRRNRNINLWLLVTFILCGLSGLTILGLEVTSANGLLLSRQAWGSVHGVSGGLMILVQIIHLVSHRKWFAFVTRRQFANKQS
jgi:hypothetical protein